MSVKLTHHRASNPRHHRRTWRQFFQVMGPGIVSGAADNDPAGVITYIQIGATTGFSLLWLMLLSTPILYVLEDMSARLGIVGKHGIGRVLCRRYGTAVAFVIVIPTLVSNVITIGADLSGTAVAVQLLTGVRWVWWVIPIAALLGVLLVGASYKVVSRVLLILTPLFLLYIAAGFIVHPRWMDVLRATFVPHIQFSPTYLAAALALLGATLTPYMFFWQTTEEVEGHERVADLADERVDVAAGMLYANLVFYFIILVAAVVIPRGAAGIGTVLEATKTLRPVAGPLATVLFAIGFFVSGIMAIPVMVACSAYTLGAAGVGRGTEQKGVAGPRVLRAAERRPGRGGPHRAGRYFSGRIDVLVERRERALACSAVPGAPHALQRSPSCPRAP